MKYDHGHWDSGKESEQGDCGPLSDPAASVPGGELHIERVHQGPHKGGVHGRIPNPTGHNPGDHSAEDMSRVADEYLKLLR